MMHDGLGEGQSKDDDRQRAVDDELDIPDRARPHPEQAARLAPPIALWDVLDAALLDGGQ